MRGFDADPALRPAALGFAIYDTAIGDCGIVWTAHAVCGSLLPGDDEAATRRAMHRLWPGVVEGAPPPHAQAALAGVRDVMQGRRDTLDWIALDTIGIPPFDARIYALARQIPPGRTTTYGALAAQAGEPGAARAVGQAMGHNRFAPIVPCHRVLAAGGREGGFSAPGGVGAKRRMLMIEGARPPGDEPTLF